MKKTILIVTAFVFITLLLSNTQVKKINSFVMTVLSEEPVLPSTPFEYGFDFPMHLFPNDTIILGYGGGGDPDTTVLPTISNNGATLGRVLFYDKKLSSSEDISCGSCHDQSLSFTENKSFSDGVTGLTKRNSMHLNDLGWSNRELFTWALTHENIHEMIRIPLTDENEIGIDPEEVSEKLSSTSYYPNLFKNAFGTTEISEERIVDALVQFIHSMNTLNSKFDQELTVDFEGFSPIEKRGQLLFGENCSGCHTQGAHQASSPINIFVPAGSPLNTSPFIFNNGLPLDEDDKGAGEINPGLDYLYKIPTLRNIALTAPYMHDGRFSNLEEVIDHYSEKVESNDWTDFSGLLPEGGFKFSQYDKDALMAFMQTLTDESFLTNPKWSDPFASPTANEYPKTIERLSVSPNPTSDFANVKFENDNNEKVKINILSNDGTLLDSFETEASEFTFTKNKFSAGLYLIQIIKNTETATVKILVQ